MKNKLPPILLALCILMLTACGPKAPVFDTAKFSVAEKDVTYCTMNGLPQTMDVYYPSSGGPWPVVLYVHGGSWYQGDKAEGEGWRGLNDSGFLVISVNYRLGDYQTKFPAMIEDVKCAVRYLRAHSAEYNLDPDNIGVIGASAGGHLVALLGTADESAGWDVGEYLEQSSKVQAVVVISGISDFTSNIPSGLNTSIFGSGIEISDNDFKAAGTFMTSSVLNANVAKFSETREFFGAFAPFVPFALSIVTSTLPLPKNLC